MNAASITNLTIADNVSLRTCKVQSICDYLVSPDGIIEILNNAEGCNSQEEVEKACASLINEISIFYEVINQPNPFTIITTLSYKLKQPETVQFSVFSHLVELVYRAQENQLQGKQQLIWNSIGYANSIYYYRLQVGKQVVSGKLLKIKQ